MFGTSLGSLLLPFLFNQNPHLHRQQHDHRFPFTKVSSGGHGCNGVYSRLVAFSLSPATSESSTGHNIVGVEETDDASVKTVRDETSGFVGTVESSFDQDTPQAEMEQTSIMPKRTNAPSQQLPQNNDEDSLLSPPRKIINDVQSIYRDLAGTGCFSTNNYYSPMVQFKYMSPTSIRGTNNNNDIMFNFDTVGSDSNTTIQAVFKHIQSQHPLHSHPQQDQEDKTIAIYIPGLDGVGISATTQFDDLSDNFEFWRMYIDDKDTTISYRDLIQIITNFICDLAVQNNRKFILVGESFGGLVVPTVALKLQNDKRLNHQQQMLLQGLVLVNPATSFDQTSWSTFVPLLASLRHIEQDQQSLTQTSQSSQLPTLYSVLGGIALAATVPDNTQYQSIFNLFSQTTVKTTEELSDVLLAMKDGFGILADRLPAEVIEHRVNNWMNVGCMLLNENSRLENLKTQILVIAGEDDNMLPTRKEADRLVKIIPNCTSMIVKGSGHFVLDGRFNLTHAILETPSIYKNQLLQNSKNNANHKNYDPIIDWKQPSPSTIEKTIESRVKPLRTLTSPIFFSTGLDGKRRKGLGFVPSHNHKSGVDGIEEKKKPLLFVANHQLLGLDLGMIIAQLIEERGMNARGLAHPIIFQAGDGFGGGFGPGDDSGNDSRIERRDRDGRIKDSNAKAGGTFEEFGAVMVSPKNYYRLMETGQIGLLFPGGVREVFHGKDEAYELFWPEKVDFVRVAARFNATIVPISAVGAADSANILVDAPDMLNLPFGLGERAANNTKNVISARYDTMDSEELFQPPLVVPKPLPSRHYFIFGKPFDTTPIDHKNKEVCAKLYNDVKFELKRGLNDLLVAKENDPFKNTAQRLAYERVYGKQAPTFSLDDLN